MLSVVIPARDAEPWIGQQLEALASQDLDGEWEVILADNGSTDRTVEVFEAFAGRLPATQVIDASARPGQAHARNRGAAASRGDALVFLDADDVVAPGYLQAVRTGLAECDVGVGSLDERFLNDALTQDVVAQDPAGTDTGIGLEPYLGFLPAGPGAALSAWRAVFDRLDGFDVALPPGEDIDFCWRAQLAGLRLARIPGATVRYRHRTGLRDLFRQAVRYGAVRPLLYRRFRDRGMRRRTGRAAVRFYLGLFPLVVRVRNRSDLERLVVLAGTRVGHILGSFRYRTWYP